jgi:hypothetical protein
MIRKELSNFLIVLKFKLMFTNFKIHEILFDSNINKNEK